jgi:hypothetical protein
MDVDKLRQQIARLTARVKDVPPVVVGEGRSLVFRRDQVGPGDAGLEVWSLFVTLTDSKGRLVAETSIWLGPRGVEQSLADFFFELRGMGWDGEKVWDGMEGGLILTCRRDGELQRIRIKIELKELSGAGWTDSSEVVLEPATLSSAVDELRVLLTIQVR